MTQHNNGKENSTDQKPDSLPTNQSSVPLSSGNPDRGSWEETLGDFGSRLISRRNAITDWVKGNIISPAQPISVWKQDAATLSQQISTKVLWSNSVAQRASELSLMISNAQQGNDFLCEPTEFAWFNPERANSAQIIGDRAPHHVDSLDIDGWQQRENRDHTEYSSTTHRESINTSPRQMLQFKAIAHSEPIIASEHTPVFTSKPYLPQVPAQFKTAIDSQFTDLTASSQHQSSTPESEPVYSPKETTRNLQSEDIHSFSDKENSPTLQIYPEKISPPSKFAAAKSETAPTDSAAHHHPDTVTDTSRSQESILPPALSVEKPLIIHKPAHTPASNVETPAFKKSSESTTAQPVPDTKLISSLTASMPTDKRLAETVTEKYQPDKTIVTHYPETKQVPSIQPSLMAHSHMEPIQRGPKSPSILTDTTDWIGGKSNQSLPAKSSLPDQGQTSSSTPYFGNKPFQKTSEVPGSNIESTIAPAFEHSSTYLSDPDIEISRKDSEVITLPSYRPSHNVASNNPPKGYDRIELFLATLEGIPRKDTSSQDIALAPADRPAARSASSEPTESTAGSTSQNEGTDVEALAREVYTIIKRRLAIERERVICV